MFTVKNGLKQGGALSPFLFKFTSKYAVRRVQLNQDGLKLKGTHQFLYVDDVSILEGTVHTVKGNTETLIVASKEIGLEVNAGKFKYMVKSGDQNAGRSHAMKVDNSSLKGWKSSSIWEQT